MIRILLLLGLFIIKYSFSTSYGILNLKDFTKKYNFNISYNSTLGHIVIKKENYKVLFMTQSNIAITNQNEFFKFELPFIRKNKDILLPLSFEKTISKSYKKYKTQIKLDIQGNHKINFIIIDPGHGKKDPGNIHNGIIEKDLNLTISLELQILLKNKFPNIKILLTREKDIFISLEDRTSLAIKMKNKYKKGIYISIHGNSSPNLDAKGIETYFFSSTPSMEKSLRLKCLIDNIKSFTDKFKKKDLTNILIKMEDLKISKESFFLAKNVHNNLYKNLKNYTLDRGIKEHHYFVIQNVNFISILIEIGFLSNKEESENLKKKSYQNKIVHGIYNGLVEFISKFNESNGLLNGY